MRYLPELDGLRALAVCAVLAFHAGAPMAQSGYLGVDLFFVLSGFLITSILVAEHERSGEIAVGRFYARRALRLYPSLLLMLSVFVVVAPLLWPELPAVRYALWSALYLSDYTRALIGEPEVLSYTWSLSVEEHFYLLWPLVVPALLKAKSPVRALVAAYVAVTAWRISNYYWLGWEATYFRFDTRLSGLIMGALISFWKPDIRRFTNLSAVALLAVIASQSYYQSNGLTWFVPIAEIASAVLVIACAKQLSWTRWLGGPVLTYIGRISYGMYIWHFPVVYWLRDHYPWHIALAGSGLFAIAMAALTHNFIDSPLKRLRFQQQAQLR